MFKKRIIAFLLLPLLAGCARQTQPPLKPVSRLAVRLEVTGAVTRSYDSPEKIGAVLCRLRLLEPLGAAGPAPEHVGGLRYEFLVWDSAGGCTRYRLKDLHYLSKNARPWQNVSETRAQVLVRLVRKLPSDT